MSHASSNSFNKAMVDVKNGFLRYPIWIHQAYHQLSAKYKRTVFGTLWISGNFLFMSFSVAFVFSSLFNHDLKVFLPFCLLGNLVGTSFVWIITEAPDLFMTNSPIIKNNALPFTTYAFEAVCKLLILFLHNLAVYFFVVIIFGIAPIPSWEAIISLILLPIMILPWGVLIGMISARYRDLRFLLPNLATLMFFLTPIYWMPDMLGERIYIAKLNPLYHMVSIVREPLLGRAPTMENWVYSIVFTLIGIALFLIFFPMFRKKIPFWV